MKLYLLICLIPSVVLCWKPISGPNGYTISQTHPSLPTAQKLTAKQSDNAAAPSILDSLTFHTGNSFLDDTSSGHDETIFTVTEGRILTKKAPYFQGNFYNGLVSGSNGLGDTCSVDKFALDHEGTVQYDASIPSLEQFTLCTWMRFTNHSGDHTLFTYSVEDEPREIQLWIANARGASYISMAVHGQSLFRLNYPFKMRTWHHACASWNGKTGEWQLWIKAERVGRGFHNRLVNFKIRPHGLAFGGGPSFTGAVAQHLHAEVTLTQLYKIALSAGKAHRDHKHHHVHHFDHNGPISTTPAPPPPAPVQPQPINPLLANGQFPSRVKINYAGVQSTPAPALPISGIPSQVIGSSLLAQNQATIPTQFSNGQFHAGGRILTEQLLTGNILQSQISPSQSPLIFPPSPQSPTSYSSIGGSHILFKREKNIKKRQTVNSKSEKKLDKRGLVMLNDGSIIDDGLLGNSAYAFEGLAKFGLPSFKAELTKSMNIEDEIKEHDREPAEGEVQAVMRLCSACDTEPFEGALVMAWKDIRGKPNNALRAKTMGDCGHF